MTDEHLESVSTVIIWTNDIIIFSAWIYGLIYFILEVMLR